MPNPTQVKDLRPISKTSNFSKIFEDFLFSWLYDDVKESLDPQQFRFHPKHSTIHYLVIMMEEILSHLESPGSYVDFLIGDMVKAFDLLAHYIVVSGTAEVIARQTLGRQMASFLSLGWESQTSKLVQGGASLLRQFAQLQRFGLSLHNFTNLFKTYAYPALEYGCQIWHSGLTKAQDLKIERIQKRAC